MPLEVGRVYFIGLLHPDPVNTPSPVDYVAKADTFHEIPAVQSLRRPESIRRHFGVVARYDESASTAVVFLGSSKPQQPHRFVPWLGTARRRGQPRTPLTPAPPDAFVDHPGYLNFSHAVKVKVMREGDLFTPTVPATVLIQQATASGALIDVVLPPAEQGHLTKLHSGYWARKRYDESGSDAGNTPPEPSEPGPDASGRRLSRQTTNGSVRQTTSCPASSQPSSRGVTIDPGTGRTVASLVAQAAREEDERATQLELMETEDEQHPPQLKAIFLPCSYEVLSTHYPGEDEETPSPSFAT